MSVKIENMMKQINFRKKKVFDEIKCFSAAFSRDNLCMLIGTMKKILVYDT